MTSWALYIYFTATKLLQIYFVFNPLLFTRGCHGSSCYIRWRLWPQGHQRFLWRTAEPWPSRAPAASLAPWGQDTSPSTRSTRSFPGLLLLIAQEVNRSKKPNLIDCIVFNRLGRITVCSTLTFSTTSLPISPGGETSYLEGYGFFTLISPLKVRLTLRWLLSRLPLHLECDPS